MKTLISLFAALLLLSGPGCGSDPPAAGPPPAGFAEYYAGEMFLAEKTKLQRGDSTTLAARLDSLRRRHGLTIRERDSLLSYCQASIPRWEAFLEEVLANLESRGNAEKGPGGVRESTDRTGSGRADTGDAGSVRP
jgi:hypothetical protein